MKASNVIMISAVLGMGHQLPAAYLKNEYKMPQVDKKPWLKKKKGRS